MHTRRGHTLVELITVVALVSVVASVGVTSTVELDDHQDAQVGVRKVRSALVEARSLARTTQRCVQVTLDAHALRLTPWEDCEPDLSATTTTWELGDVTLSSFSDGSRTLLFDDDGGLATDEPVDLDVTTPRGTHTYRIYPAIGTVRLVSE